MTYVALFISYNRKWFPDSEPMQRHFDPGKIHTWLRQMFREAIQANVDSPEPSKFWVLCPYYHKDHYGHLTTLFNDLTHPLNKYVEQVIKSRVEGGRARVLVKKDFNLKLRHGSFKGKSSNGWMDRLFLGPNKRDSQLLQKDFWFCGLYAEEERN